MTGREGDWFTEGIAAVSTLCAIYSAAGTRTHARTVNERKGLFLDPCFVSEIASEPSELSHFHFATMERFVVEVAAGILP